MGSPRCAELSPGRAEGPFQNRVGQVRDLRRDRLQALLANDIAIGDPQRLAALEPPQRAEHRLLVLQGRDFRHQVLDEHLPGHRRPFGQPQQVKALRIGDQQVREMLAGRKDLDQRRQRRGVALEERADAERIAGLGHEAVQVVQRHIGIGATGQDLAELIADHGQEIERHTRRCHAHQGRVGATRIDHAQAFQEFLRGVGIVEPVAKGGSTYVGERRGSGHNLECGDLSPLCGRFAAFSRHGQRTSESRSPRSMLFLFLKTTLVDLFKCYHAYDQAWPHEKDLRLFLRAANANIIRTLVGIRLAGVLLLIVRPTLAVVVPTVSADAIEQVTAI